MPITTNLGGLTVNSVKQLFAAPSKKPDSAEATETMAPLDRLRALMAKNGGQVSYEVASALFKLPEEDQKAVAAELGGWVATVYDQMENYAEFGLREAVIAGIHQAAAQGREWTGFVEVGGENYGVGTGADPARVKELAQQEVADYEGQLRWQLDMVDKVVKENPDWLADLPDRMSTESVTSGDNGNLLQDTLFQLKKLGVSGLAVTRGSDGAYTTGSFRFETTGSVRDWNHGDHAYAVRGSGVLGSWSLTADLPRLNVVA